MFAKIKIFFMAGVSILAAVLYGLFQSEKRKREHDKRVAKEKEQEIERLGVEAAFTGLKKEADIQNEKIGASDRDHFS